jgi:hypothetical protein
MNFKSHPGLRDLGVMDIGVSLLDDVAGLSGFEQRFSQSASVPTAPSRAFLCFSQRAVQWR